MVAVPERLRIRLRRAILALVRRAGLMPIVSAASNLRYRLLRRYWARTGQDVLEKIYDDAFFAEMNEIHASGRTPNAVAAEIVRVFRPRSVVDVGCGTGIYMAPLLERRIEVLGIDGSAACLRSAVVDPALIRLADVTRPVGIGRRFDLAICFEVAEHIEVHRSRALVENLCSLSDTVLLTAAPRGQGGVDHINEQSREFWIRLFADIGYECDDALRESMAVRLRNSGCVFWIPENLFVFRNRRPVAEKGSTVGSEHVR